MEKIRIGIVGAGNISKMHLQSYRNNPKAELAALCDINEERLSEKAGLYGIKATYTDYREMLQKEKLDAISVCVWNNVHAAVSIAALEAGVNVLCEKPLTISNEEARQVEEAVKRTGMQFMVGFVRRNAENTQVLKRFIDSGDLGEIYYSKLNCFRRIGNPGGWFADITRSGGGPVIDLGVHLIDVAWYLMGKPRPITVSANTYQKLGNFSNIQNKTFYRAADYSTDKNDVEDLANALIRFENGASMIMDVSYSLHTERDSIKAEIFGTKGGGILEPCCKVFSEMHDTLVDITPYMDNLTFNFDVGFQQEIDNFVRICCGEIENFSPVEDGVQVMGMLNGIYESAKQNREISL